MTYEKDNDHFHFDMGFIVGAGLSTVISVLVGISILNTHDKQWQDECVKYGVAKYVQTGALGQDTKWVWTATNSIPQEKN